VYDLDKMQNETEEERTNRLQKRKQDQATETVDERARILEILRALFHPASSNENDQESHEQFSMSVDPTVDIPYLFLKQTRIMSLYMKQRGQG
jgi:hypothetical protein